MLLVRRLGAAVVEAAVKGLGDGAAAERLRALQWEFCVVDDGQEANASITPGGKVSVGTACASVSAHTVCGLYRCVVFLTRPLMQSSLRLPYRTSQDQVAAHTLDHTANRATSSHAWYLEWNRS